MVMTLSRHTRENNMAWIPQGMLYTCSAPKHFWHKDSKAYSNYKSVIPVFREIPQPRAFISYANRVIKPR